MADIQEGINQAVLTVAKAVEDRVDEELHRLENLGEEDIAQLRTKRIAELKKLAEKRQEWLASGHGEYRELSTEKDFFREVKGVERVVCHFYRETMPCKIMDKHLRDLAAKHLETKFVKIHAEKSPYLTEKLKIWMLPTLALIKLEKTVDYVVGFDDLGGTDSFSTDVLEDRLAACDLVFSESGMGAQRKTAGKQEKPSVRKGFAFEKTASDESSDFSD